MADVEASLERILLDLGEGRAVDWGAHEAEHPEIVPELRERLRLLQQQGLLPGSSEQEVGPWSGEGWNFETRYVLREELGAGGMGRVWRTFDRQLQREVALKQLASDRMRPFSNQAAERFLAEARAMARLEHPNIVPIHDAGHAQDGTPYLTMKLVDGGTLKERMRSWENGSLDRPPERDVLRYLVAAARAVHSAHACGVLHRDLKPSNLLLDRFDRILVADWGLASLEGKAGLLAHGELASSPEFTATGQLIGTPSYMAPEQARGESTSQATDVWGLGAILHQLLTGVPPFSGRTMEELLDAARAGRIEDDALRNARVAKALRAICLKTLASRREDRFASAEALAQDLDAYLNGEPGSTWKDPAIVRVARVVKRRPVASMWGVVCLIVLAAAWEVWRTSAASARLRVPNVVSADLEEWGRIRDGFHFANDSRSLDSWLSEYLQYSARMLAGYGSAKELTVLRGVNPALERRVLDELYLHAFALFKGGAVNTWLLREGRVQPPHPAAQGDVGTWERLLEELPNLADAWDDVTSLLGELESEPAMRAMWNAAAGFMESGHVGEEMLRARPGGSRSVNAIVGRTLVEAGLDEAAISFLNEAIRQDPERSSLYFDWSLAARRLKAVDDWALLSHLATYAALESERAWANAALGAKLFALGERPEATAWIARSMKLDSHVGAPIAFSLYGADPKYAVGLLEESLVADPEDSFAIKVLADVCAQEGDVERELGLRRRAVELLNDALSHSKLATCLQRLGGSPHPPRSALDRARLEEALTAWEEVGRLLVSYRARQEIGVLRVALGNYAEGLVELERSMAERREDLASSRRLSLESHRRRVRDLTAAPFRDLLEGEHVPAEFRARADALLRSAESFLSD